MLCARQRGSKLHFSWLKFLTRATAEERNNVLNKTGQCKLFQLIRKRGERSLTSQVDLIHQKLRLSLVRPNEASIN